MGTCTLALFLDTANKLASSFLPEHDESVGFDEVSRVVIPSNCGLLLAHVFDSFLGDVVSVAEAHSALPTALEVAVLPPS